MRAHTRLRQLSRARSAATTACWTRSRLTTFDGHDPQQALGMATQSWSLTHARHVAGMALMLVGSVVA
jgi:hypothetical protein